MGLKTNKHKINTNNTNNKTYTTTTNNDILIVSLVGGGAVIVLVIWVVPIAIGYGHAATITPARAPSAPGQKQHVRFCLPAPSSVGMKGPAPEDFMAASWLKRNAGSSSGCSTSTSAGSRAFLIGFPATQRKIWVEAEGLTAKSCCLVTPLQTKRPGHPKCGNRRLAGWLVCGCPWLSKKLWA